jgi:hypothetical protein
MKSERVVHEETVLYIHAEDPRKGNLILTRMKQKEEIDIDHQGNVDYSPKILIKIHQGARNDPR